MVIESQVPMVNDDNDAFGSQLRNLQEAISKVSELQASVKIAIREFDEQRTLNGETLKVLDALTVRVAEAFDSLLKATGFLDELRRSTGPITTQVTQSLYEFQRVMTESLQAVSSGLSSIPRTLSTLETTGDRLNDDVRKVSTDLFVVTDNLSKLHDELLAKMREDHGSSMSHRLDLVGPAAIAGTIVGVVLIDITLVKAIIWTVVTLGLVVAGLPTGVVARGIRAGITRLRE